jgi:phosphatidylserine decarboxylase
MAGMEEVDVLREPAVVRPLPANIDGVQPSGGWGYRVELAWGYVRRGWLRTFRRLYVRRMAALRRGDVGQPPPGAPHAILDPRDLKYCRNRVNCWWDAADDPFRWRERIPLARWGLAELLLVAGPLAGAAVGLALLPTPYRYLATVPGALCALVTYFFRDPPRRIPTGAGLVVSPADGRIVEITELEDDAFVGGPALRIGIFLSIFNVHVNRSPVRGRVIELRYLPGEFLNALNPESARRNESMWIALEETDSDRRMVVRQISGAIARRIVCDLKPGETIERGQKFGMIKLGSRTELILPLADALQIEVNFGDRVKAGATVLARYRDS